MLKKLNFISKYFKPSGSSVNSRLYTLTTFNYNTNDNDKKFRNLKMENNNREAPNSKIVDKKYYNSERNNFQKETRDTNIYYKRSDNFKQENYERQNANSKISRKESNYLLNKDEEIASLNNSNNSQAKLNFIFKLFNLENTNKYEMYTWDTQISEIFSSPQLEEKLKIVIKCVLPLINIEHKKKIVHIIEANKKTPVYIYTHIIKEIVKLNLEADIVEDSYLLIEYLDMLKNVKIEHLKTTQVEVDNLYNSINDNFTKYEQLFAHSGELFYKICNKLLSLSFLNRNHKHLDFNPSHKFYDSLSNLFLQNFENLNILEVANYLKKFDSNFYKNEELLTKILDNFHTYEKKLTNINFNKLIEDLTFITINSNILKSHNKGLSFSLTIIDNIKNRLKVKSDLKAAIRNLKNLTYIQLLGINYFKNSDLIKVTEDLINQCINTLHRSFIIEDVNLSKEKLRPLLLYFYNPLIYVKSCKSPSLNKQKINELVSYMQDTVGKDLEKAVISDFHREVCKTLIEMGIKYTVEDQQDYLSKDIALDGYKICIEADGIRHYYQDGKELFTTEFRRSILQNMGWKVINVNSMKWDKLNELKKKELIRLKIRENL